MARAKTGGGGKRGQARDRARPDTGTRRALVEEKLFRVSAELFAERGYGGTSLQDIAEAMEMSRPALYYYVKSKDEILARLVEKVQLRDAEILRDIAAQKELAPVEQLRAAVLATTARIARSPDRYRLLDRNEPHLSKAVAKRFAEAKRDVLRSFIAMIERGMAKGSFRAVDPRTAALSILGMCNWVAWWYSPDDGSVEEIGAQIADLAVSSVLASDGTETSAAGIVSLIRDDLARLEKLI